MAERTAEERRRAELADELVAVTAGLFRRFRTRLLPEALQAQLGAPTAHQLEALHVLQHAHDRGIRGVTMNELARRQGCALSSASALADRLLREGLAERVPDPSDRRVVRLVTTAKGDEFCRQFADVKRSVALDTLRELSVAEMETLLALLRKAGGERTSSRAEDLVHG